MTQLTSEDVRAVVRDEQAHIEKTLDQIAVSIEKMADFMAKSKAEEKANEQKFIRVHERIDGHDHRINEQSQSLITITAELLPSLEQEVAKNTLSTGVFWKFLLMAVTPLVSGLGAVLWIFQKAQQTQNEAISRAISELAKALAGG